MDEVCLGTAMNQAKDTDEGKKEASNTFVLPLQ
jgi:hypothetical protein